MAYSVNDGVVKVPTTVFTKSWPPTMPRRKVPHVFGSSMVNPIMGAVSTAARSTFLSASKSSASSMRNAATSSRKHVVARFSCTTANHVASASIPRTPKRRTKVAASRSQAFRRCSTSCIW